MSQLKKSVTAIFESVKLIKTIDNGPHAAKVYYDSDVEEYHVKFYTNGKWLGEDPTYYTDDKEDAIGTASAELKMIAKNQTESKQLKEAKEFKDSSEATEFVDKISAMMNDPRLLQWCKATDSNYGTRAADALTKARTSFKNVIDWLDEADEDQVEP